ncbi:hypothetical protein ACFX13_046850 [Malus domestica]
MMEAASDKFVVVGIRRNWLLVSEEAVPCSRSHVYRLQLRRQAAQLSPLSDIQTIRFRHRREVRLLWKAFT